MPLFRDEDESLVALARQLADAYGEAGTQQDQDFACDEIAGFLSDHRTSAPAEALVALFDLPVTAETFPLVDEAQEAIAARGREAVRALVTAAAGEVYDPAGPASERALETLGRMDRNEAAAGLVEVLRGRVGDRVKDAAVRALVEIGAVAEPHLAGAAEDAGGRQWVQAALGQLRFARRHHDVDGSSMPDTVEELLARANAPAAKDADPAAGAGAPGVAEEPEAMGGAEEAPDGEAEPASAGVPDDAEPVADPPAEPAAEGPPAGPDQTVVDDSYDGFLRRFEDESDRGSEGGAPT